MRMTDLSACVCFVGVKGVQVEEIYDLQSKCQRYAVYTSYLNLNLFGEGRFNANQRQVMIVTF